MATLDFVFIYFNLVLSSHGLPVFKFTCELLLQFAILKVTLIFYLIYLASEAVPKILFVINEMRTFCGFTRFLFIRREKEIVSYMRICNKSYSSDPLASLNPFKKCTHNPVKTEYDSRIASRICVTILGNGGIGQPRCIGLFTEFKSYLFNCGEGVGRYCKEYDINPCLIKHIFITQRKWENLSGLSDIYVSNQAFGVYNIALYGPPGIEYFLSMLSAKQLDTKINKKEGGYTDHTLKVDCIPILSKKEPFSLSTDNKKTHLKSEPDVYSYVCKIFERPGDLLIEKCIEHGVPIGPDLSKLKNWENIVLPCGKIVYAEDVHAPSYPERLLLIVDCPSESFLESFVSEKEFQKYQKPRNLSSEVSVFHFTPSHILKSDKYQDWINKFHATTRHIVLNSDNSIISSNTIHQTLRYFNLLHPKIFRKLKEKELAPENSSFSNDKVIYPPPMLKMYFRPKEQFSWSNVFKEEDDLNIAIDGTDIVMSSPEFYEKLKDLKTSILHKSLINAGTSIYPEVTFLGTSSSTSTAYRNVSAILLNTSPDNSILLDCGEGTLMQFTRYFGSDVDSVLRNISCIFISHKHLDHYVGLFQLISQRVKSFEKSGQLYQPIALILPVDIHNIFMRFSEVFENLYPLVNLFACHYLKKKRNTLKKYIGDVELLTVPVKHCSDAWGVVLTFESQWKIVYSGDSAPCQSLIDAGKDCTLLIHEASIEDGMVIEALAKRHSTPSQVIDIAEKMNAEHTIMTHFSKRYLGFPVLPEKNSKDIACAFDFMKVRMCDLSLLPLFTPVIKCLFEGQLETHTENVSSIVNFENAFLKSFKS